MVLIFSSPWRLVSRSNAENRCRLAAVSGLWAGLYRPRPGIADLFATHRRQLVALHAAGLVDRIRWGRPGLSVGQGQAAG